MKIAPITLCRVPDYSGLSEESADNYYRAGQRKALISAEIINPFESSLRDSTGYSDENMPEEEVCFAKEIGGFRFALKAAPTTKRPGYKEVFEGIYAYLRTKQAEYKAGERPVGVFTFDGEAYISAEDVLGRIRKAKRKVTSKGVKIEIANSPVPPHTDSMVVPLGMDMSELSEGNVNRYLEALFLSEGYGSFASDFEEELLGLTGYSSSHPPETTEHMFKQMGTHIFHVKSIPYESIGYGKIVGGLDAEPGKRKPENGGDLVLVTREIEVPKLEIYHSRRRDGEHLIRLNALLKRMNKLVKDNTQTKVRQKPIIHYPIV